MEAVLSEGGVLSLKRGHRNHPAGQIYEALAGIEGADAVPVAHRRGASAGSWRHCQGRPGDGPVVNPDCPRPAATAVGRDALLEPVTAGASRNCSSISTSGPATAGRGLPTTTRIRRASSKRPNTPAPTQAALPTLTRIEPISARSFPGTTPDIVIADWRC